MAADLHSALSPAASLLKQIRDDQLRARWARKVGEVTMGRSFSDFVPLEYKVLTPGDTNSEIADRMERRPTTMSKTNWGTYNSVVTIPENIMEPIQVSFDSKDPEAATLPEFIRRMFVLPKKREPSEFPEVPDSGLLIPFLDLRYESPLQRIGSRYRLLGFDEERY